MLLEYNGACGNHDINSYAGAPTNIYPAMRSTLASVPQSYGSQTFFTGTDQHLHMLLNYNGAWGNHDLNSECQAPTNISPVAGSALAAISVGGGNSETFFLGADQHVHMLLEYNGACGNHDINSYAGAPTNVLPVAGSALASVVQSYGSQTFFIGTDQHVHMLLNDNGAWGNHDVAGYAGAPSALAGSPLSAVAVGSGAAVAFVSSDEHVHVLVSWSGNWEDDDITAQSASPTAGQGALNTFVLGNNLYVQFVGSNGDVYQVVFGGSGATVSDSGTVSLSAEGVSATACFGGSSNPVCKGQSANGTAAQVASALVQSINNSQAFPAKASVSGATITLTWKEGGPFSVPVSPLSTTHDNPNLFSSPSFTSTAATMSGGGSGNAGYNFALGHAPDGQITSANDLINGNWTFGYDQFNRLVSSNKNSGQTAFNYAYDRYGNRSQQNLTAGTGASPQYSFDLNNHIVGSGVVYDALGNVINDGFHSYTYDAENRLVQVDGGNTAKYVYDALGRRVEGPNGDYLYDLAGHAETIIGLNGVWSYGEIYAGGRHLATYSGATTNFFHPDWLGTKRAMTGMNGAISETCTGFAFGDGMNCTGTNWSFNSFTDDIHDSETNLEHTLFRQYSSTQGRWLTPDPAGTASAAPTNPQSWNRYTYVLGDPANSIDPTGLDNECPSQECYGLGDNQFLPDTFVGPIGFGGAVLGDDTGQCLGPDGVMPCPSGKAPSDPGNAGRSEFPEPIPTPGPPPIHDCVRIFGTCLGLIPYVPTPPITLRPLRTTATVQAAVPKKRRTWVQLRGACYAMYVQGNNGISGDPPLPGSYGDPGSSAFNPPSYVYQQTTPSEPGGNLPSGQALVTVNPGTAGATLSGPFGGGIGAIGVGFGTLPAIDACATALYNGPGNIYY